MSQDHEPRFAGRPSIPPPEVFDRARQNNPAWFQVIEQAYAQFAARPEHQGVYADPEGPGATVHQMWLTYTLFGIAPYCVLARSLPARATREITRLVQCTPSELIASFMALQRLTGGVGVQLAFHDGAMGHAVFVTSYDNERDRFTFHDPWPERSLLCLENNAAGIDAQPEGTRWSVTSEELTRVAFVAYFFPHQWAKINGQAFELFYPELLASEFFAFFRVRLLDERTEDGTILRLHAPGAFRDAIKLVVGCIESTGRVSGAALQVRSDWLRANLPMALDLARSFIGAFAPVPDRDHLDAIARELWSPIAPHPAVAASCNTSEAASIAGAFMGAAERSVVTTDFSTLTAGVMQMAGAPWHSLEYKLV